MLKIAFKEETNIPKVKILVNQSICIGCGVCEEICPFGLFEKTVSNKYNIADPKLCTECSACFKNCPVGAIFMHEKKGCGCLWDVKARKKGNKDNCCDSNCC